MKHFSKILSSFLTFFLFIQVIAGVFLFVPKQTKAGFSEDFNNTSQISSRAGLNLNTTTGTVTLPQFETSLDDEDTLLLSYMGSDSDITSPAIGTGGTVSGVAYDAGYDGNAATAGSGDTLRFPKSGNFNANVGTISMCLKLADWDVHQTVWYFRDSNDGYSFGAYQEYNASVPRIDFRFYVNASGNYKRQDSSWALGSFAPNSWQCFTFSWDASAGVLYSSLGAVYYFEPFTIGASGTHLRFGEGNGIDVSVDEVRITNKMYKGSAYDSYNPRILTSTSFNTGVANPVWGNIEWDETKPSKSDIFIQTNVSSDNSTWDGWLTKGMVTFTFDDGYKSQYTNGYPILEQYGFKGTAYVVKNLLYDNSGSSTYMSLADLNTLEDAGWEIGGHGETHADLDTLTEEQVRQEFGTGCHDYLENQGLNIRSMATPYGRSISGYKTRVLSDYYEYVRAYAYGAVVGTYPQYYGKYGVGWAYTAWPGSQSSVDSAEANKTWAVFTQHDVSANDSILAPLAAYVATKNVDVVTFSDGMDRLHYSNSAGSQITSANKRYTKYRAIFFSDTGDSAPTLSSVKIHEPTKIYKELTNTINANGNITHSVWPQTTDTEINTLSITPSDGSVTVSIDTWDTSGDYYKKWTESGATADITTAHTVGDLQNGQYYQAKVDGTVIETLQANGSGQISFTYSGGYSDKEFEVEEFPLPTAPSIGTPTVLSTSSIRWNFTDNADNEAGFRLYDNSDSIISTNATADLTYIDETGLFENTQYTGRYIKSYNASGNSSASSAAASKYTLIDTPTNLDNSATRGAIRLSVDSFPNSSSGSSGYYFYRTDNASRNSGWINTNAWTDSGLTCGSKYNYSVKYRNGDGVETSTASLSQNTEPCVSEGGSQENNNIEKEEEPISPKKTDLNPQGKFGILVNGGVDYTKTRIVQLKLFAGSDTKYMLVSENSDFTGAKQEEYKEDKIWTLSKGDGKKTIYAKFLTLYDVASKVVSASIILDTSPPSSPIITNPKNYSAISDNTPTIIGTAEPDSSIILELAAKDSTTYYSTTADSKGNFDYTFLKPLANNDYTLAATAQDQAGNLSKTIETHFKIETPITPRPLIPSIPESVSPPGQEQEITPPEEQPGQAQEEEAVPSLPEKEVSQAPLSLPFNLLVFKSLYGDISLNPPLTLISGQKLKVFLKPERAVKAIKIIIIFQKPREKDTSFESRNSALSSLLGIPEAKAQIWRIAEYTLADQDNDGLYEGEITMPETTGEYLIRATLFYADGTLEDLDTETLIDPKGYIWTPAKNNQETRVNKAIISLYVFNAETNAFELWQSAKYDQENPQNTDKTGEYEFLVPRGKYYLKAEAKGYRTFQSEDFQAEEGDVICQNIELAPKKTNSKWLILGGVILILAIGGIGVWKKRRG